MNRHDNKPLQTWMALPHDSLIFRDGRPFTAVPGARAKTLPFPFPSTVAGAVRTRSGTLAHGGRFPEDSNVIKQVKSYRVVGPFLYSLTKKMPLFPAPQDAWLMQVDPPSETEALLLPLSPTLRFNKQGVITNLPEELYPVAPPKPVQAKPHPAAPAFWYWNAYREWLETPQTVPRKKLVELGIPPLPLDVRMHVSIQEGTGTAEEGALFQTVGLSLVRAPQTEGSPDLAKVEEFALLVQTDAEPFDEGMGPLGGERRMVTWERADIAMPGCPDKVRENILASRRGRLILVTPAVFEQGFLPTWVCQHPTGVRLRITGAAVSRPVHVSGWDYEKGAPKPSRRLAPSGSVYFFEIVEGDDRAIERFIDEVWLTPISDAEQDRRDGFGVALLGVWKEENHA